MHRRLRPGAARGLALLLGTLGLLSAVASPVAAQGNPTPISLVFSSNGALASNLTVEVPNGSLLRYALDGNFTPLLNALPLSAQNRSTYENEIAALEANPFTSGLFGNRDGTVEPVEVANFEQLVVSESKSIPTTALTGGALVALDLDGTPPTTATFTGLGIAGAEGPDGSTAPLEVSLLVTYDFAVTGSSHTLGVSWNETGATLLPLLRVQLTLATPAGDSVTGSSGFLSSSTNNDPWGIGAGHFSGEFVPAETGGVSVRFQPAFPVAEVLVVGGVAATVGASMLVLLLRARKRRRALIAADEAAAPPPSSSG